MCVCAQLQLCISEIIRFVAEFFRMLFPNLRYNESFYLLFWLFIFTLCVCFLYLFIFAFVYFPFVFVHISLFHSLYFFSVVGFCFFSGGLQLTKTTTYVPSCHFIDVVKHHKRPWFKLFCFTFFTLSFLSSRTAFSPSSVRSFCWTMVVFIVLLLTKRNWAYFHPKIISFYAF